MVARSGERFTALSSMLSPVWIDDVDAEAAIAESKRLWGPDGAVSYADEYPHSRCLVGELKSGRFWIRGRGSSWKAAFADAEARKIKASRRRAAH